MSKKSIKQQVVDQIMRECDEVRVLSEAEYWQRLHRLRCLSLRKREMVAITETLPEGIDLVVYREILSIGNKATHEIERHEQIEAGTAERRNDREVNPLVAMAAAWTDAAEVAAQLRGKSAHKSDA